MSYTDVFGGTAIYPSDVSYLALALPANIRLEWPLEIFNAEFPAARVIDVLPATPGGYTVSLPDATLAAPGETILFNNVSGAYGFFITDFDGNTIATVGFGSQWQVYLADNTSPAGIWRVFRYGASTATVQPSALAGFGLTVTGSTLSQAAPTTTFSTSGLTLSPANRAALFVWTGTGTGTVNLPSAASVGNNYFVMLRCGASGGTLTVDPSGGETINGAATLTLQPGDSAIAVTDGTAWYTVGFGQNAVFAFDYTAIDVSPGGTKTLTGSELNRIAYKFTGTLTSNVVIVIPSTVQQYWVNNATTGAFSLSLKTATGAPVFVNQNAKGIYYCDGLNVILASDALSISTPIGISDGGTGAVTASAARLNLGITPFADGIVTATSGAQVRTIIGAAAAGANNDITSLTALTSITAPTLTVTGDVHVSGAVTGAAATFTGTVTANIVQALAQVAAGTVGTGAINMVAAGGPANTGYIQFTNALGTRLGYIGFIPTAAGGDTSYVNENGGGHTFTSAVTATQFNGSGAGLTGSAPSLSVGFATNATNAVNATNATNATNAGHANNADFATNATNATSATNSTNAVNVTGGGSVVSTALNANNTVNDTGAIAATSPGFRGIPQVAAAGAYGLVLTDAGKQVANSSGGWVIPSNAATPFPVGTAIVLYNNSGAAQSISITTDVLHLAGSATVGTRTLAQRGIATITKVAAAEWVISGAGLS